MGTREFCHVAALASLSVTASALADFGVTLYFGAANFQPWVDATQTHTTLDFTGFAPGTFITDQYASLGAVFVPFVNPYVVQLPDAYLFPQDSYGIDGNGKVRIDFATPVNSIGAHTPSAFRFLLYSQGSLVCVTTWWWGATNGFAGLTTSFTFDSVVFDTAGPDSQVFLDNVYFRPVPAPAGALTILLGLGFGRRRR